MRGIDGVNRLRQTRRVDQHASAPARRRLADYPPLLARQGRRRRLKTEGLRRAHTWWWRRVDLSASGSMAAATTAMSLRDSLTCRGEPGAPTSVTAGQSTRPREL